MTTLLGHLLCEDRRQRSRHGIGDALRRKIDDERELGERLEAVGHRLFSFVYTKLAEMEMQP